MKNRNLILLLLFIPFISCNLDEELNGTLSEDQYKDEANPQAQLLVAYNSLQDFQNTDNMYVLQQHPTDEMAGPTRGKDWDDGGAWRALHLQTWNSSHPRVISSWNSLLAGAFRATSVLGLNGLSKSEETQAKFLRSFYIFNITDLFGQVPLRQPNEDLLQTPSLYYKRTEAIDEAINSLEPYVENLDNVNNSSLANRNAGYTLLAKMYLNKATYKATASDGTPQVVSASNFQNSDMQKVITYCNKVISSGMYSLQTNYFDNFSPNNSSISTEDIFSSVNTNQAGGEMRRFAYMTLHYNQNPGGWNGFVALTDLYDKFTDANDVRKSQSITGMTNLYGPKAGFLIGQQMGNKKYDTAEKKFVDTDPGVLHNLTTRDQNIPLIFTSNFSLTASGEAEGIRVLKYYPDYAKVDRPNNDFVFFRYADVLLMKAEAMARMGNFSGADAIVQQIRTARGATGYPAVTTLKDILDERARELYWEGWRRQDQIRFGTFLMPVQERSGTSSPNKMIFPIPDNALATIPTLTQNPGY